MPNPRNPSDLVDLELLRSQAWMAEAGCAEGAEIWIDVEEMDLHGPATVVAVEDCPPIQSGPGRVVLSTMTHFNSSVLELKLAGREERLCPTASHPLYSQTRQGWVPAGQIEVGELLVTREGTVSVEAVSALPGTHRVYNIEVEVDHCYFTGSAQVLSHNACPPSTTAVERGGNTFVRTAEFTPSTQRTYKVFQRGDINWEHIRTPGGGPRDFIGKTNAEAAQAGFRPQLADGSFVTLHHSQQSARGPWFEASTRYHNITTAQKPPLHPFTGQQHPDFPLGRGPGSLREQFQTIESPEYWTWREQNR